jgi:hypothetical protein
MIFFRKYEKKRLRSLTGFLITVIIFLNIGTSGNAQTNQNDSFGGERIRQLSILLKLSLGEYERLRNEVPCNLPRIEVVLEKVINILKEIKSVHENQRDSQERIERIKSLIRLYEGKLSSYKGASSP